jgi:hypothetical protein
MGNDLAVIDRFLDIFSRYIDSGFGLISGDVGFLVKVLIGIDVVLAALAWAAGEDEVIQGIREKGAPHWPFRVFPEQLEPACRADIQKLCRARP